MKNSDSSIFDYDPTFRYEYICFGMDVLIREYVDMHSLDDQTPNFLLLNFFSMNLLYFSKVIQSAP